MIPVVFTCEPDMITTSSVHEERWGWNTSNKEAMLKENSFIRTVDYGSATPAAGVADIHDIFEKTVSITQYIYNRNHSVAVRDFYRVNQTSITDHTCGSENPSVLPIKCDVLNSSLITGYWKLNDYKMVMDRTMKPFEYTFMADPMATSTITLGVGTTMSTTVTFNSSTQQLKTVNVSDKYTCRNKNPLTFTYPAVIDIGRVTYGNTVTAKFTLEYKGSLGALPNTILIVSPLQGNGTTSTPLGSYNLSLLLPNGKPYVFGEEITPSVTTTFNVIASPGSGAPVTGQQLTELNLMHRFN